MILLKRKIEDKLIIGHNEWCQLPDLHLPAIKAKVDTGAKTSALHAFNIKPITVKRKDFVTFDIHPLQGNEDLIVSCKAPIYDQRYIMSSNGHKEHRYVIKTTLAISHLAWEIEVTLSNRDPLRFRMLLGREALNNRVFIYPGITYHQGKMSTASVLRKYKGAY